MSEDLILIVDDNSLNVRLLTKVLEIDEYEIAIATNGHQALSLAKEKNPELILLDVMMPKMDGYEVCTRLKDNKDLQDIPIIFLTANSDTDSVIKGFDAGGVDYVTKPFNSKELLARIRTHIELKKSREAIKTLHGLLPICCYCKKIRKDNGYWQQLENYVQDHSNANFSHGVCPECFEREVTKSKMQRKMKDER